jgi:hypothetical protein
VLSTPGGGVVQFAAHGRRVRVVAVIHKKQKPVLQEFNHALF